MKKTIVRPDGTKEEIEGTSEEIAAYERQVRQEPVREETKKPGILTDELQRLLEAKYPTRFDSWRYQHDPSCDIITAQRGWWSVVPPRCTCGLFLYPTEGDFYVGDPISETFKITCDGKYNGNYVTQDGFGRRF